jgi:hypothetical protein
MEAGQVHEAVRAVYAGPFEVAIGDPADKATWRIDFGAEVSEATRAAVQAVIDALDPAQPSRRQILKSLIVGRLHAAGLLAAASQALSADLYARERWYAADRPAVPADDADVIALLEAIGADPAVILAPPA